MARAKRRREQAAAAAGTTVVVCRGGDCGSRAKHPDIDHVGLLREARERLEGVARVLPSACLDACERSNVVVVVPPDEEPVWIGEVLDADTNAAVCSFVRDGGPSAAAEPIEVELRAFRPTRRNWQELEHELGGD